MTDNSVARHEVTCPHPQCEGTLKIADDLPAGIYECICRGCKIQVDWGAPPDRQHVPCVTLVEPAPDAQSIRKLCHAYVEQIPANGLLELRDALRDMVEFYSHPPAEGQGATPPVVVASRTSATVVRPDFFAEHAKEIERQVKKSKWYVLERRYVLERTEAQNPFEYRLRLDLGEYRLYGDASKKIPYGKWYWTARTGKRIIEMSNDKRFLITVAPPLTL